MQQTGYLGPPGTFGEQAALLVAPEAGLTPLPSHGAIVQAVSRGEVDQGVVPIENSLEGAVNDSLDALLQAENVRIRAELVIPVEQCLVAAAGTRLQDIEVIMSHPQGFGQCRGFIEANCPNVRLQAELSTAAAVASSLRTPGAAAIGTRRAAELNGGEVLAAGIQDVKHNKTRFVVIALEDAEPTWDDKTSIAFTVAHDRPGTLIGALKEFSERDINLTRIESRPSREELGIYIFLIDLQGHHSDPAVAEALEAVGTRANYFRLFGSYPRFKDGA